MKNKFSILILCLGVLAIGCDNSTPIITKGYLPIYENEVKDILKVNAPQTLKRPGKIYIYKNFLFINDSGQGIHVYDNSNKKSPKNIAFYEIQGTTDMAIKNSIMYANIGAGIISIDISDPLNAQYINYIKPEGQYSNSPDPATSIKNSSGEIVFKCTSPDRGKVVAWKYGDIEGDYCTIR